MAQINPWCQISCLRFRVEGINLTRVVRPEAALAVDQERLALRGGELLFRVSGFGLPVSGLGFRVSVSEFRVSGTAFRVEGYKGTSPIRNRPPP